MATKRATGAYFTTGDCWLTKPVREFIAAIPDLKNRVVIDPFVGAGDLLGVMRREFDVTKTIGYDTKPLGEFLYNDSLSSIPQTPGAVVVTNPPWLAKHSAVRLGLYHDVARYFERTGRSDLYEIALDRVLTNFEYAVVLLPESFRSDSYRAPQRWCVVEANPFADTEAPLGVACFSREAPSDPDVYLNDGYAGKFKALRDYRFDRANPDFVFNAPAGRIFLKGVDGAKPTDVCRFGLPEEFGYKREIKASSRLLTRIEAPWLSDAQIVKLITAANLELAAVRRCNPLALTAFKGNNKLGHRRRRLDYGLARVILTKALERVG